MPKFSVTYEVVTPESAEYSDAEERGFVAENVSLRDALDHFGCGFVEPSCYPVDWSHDVWFSEADGRQNYITGGVETRSFHMPDNLTPSSRRRVARLLGWKGR